MTVAEAKQIETAAPKESEATAQTTSERVPAVLARARSTLGTMLRWREAEELLGEGKSAIRKRAIAAFWAAHPTARNHEVAEILARQGARYEWGAYRVTLIRPTPRAQWQVWVRRLPA